MRVLQITTLQSGGASIAAKRLHQALLDCEIESRILTLEKHSNNDGIISYKPFLDFSSKRIIPKIVKGLLYRFGIGMGRWWRMHVGTEERKGLSLHLPRLALPCRKPSSRPMGGRYPSAFLRRFHQLPYFLQEGEKTHRLDTSRQGHRVRWFPLQHRSRQTIF